MLRLAVSAPLLKVTTQGGSVGNAYTNQTLQATGGARGYSWAVTTGSLPSGPESEAERSGSGTPSGGSIGTDSFTATVTDWETPAAAGVGRQPEYSPITVAPLSVTTTSGSLPLGVVSTAYPGATLHPTGGMGPSASVRHHRQLARGFDS